jgi:hypothetical protein
MRKYSIEFKLEVVQSFLAGDGGAKLLARRWSLPEEKIRTWVSHYRLHGIDGLRPKRSAYSVQFKMQVLSHQDREQLSPDGHPKLLHLWPVKLLQAGRSDCDYTGVTAMREAASFKR